jgi:hypothetical protein
MNCIRIRRKILSHYHSLPAQELTEFLADLQRSLQNSPKLALLFARQTDEPERLIDLLCEPASDTLTIAEVSAELERLWLEELRYPHFEAHAVSQEGFDLTLEFVTVTGPGGFAVTGAITVDVRRIQGPVKAVEFWCRLAGRGWIEAGITDGVSQLSMVPSYLSDGPADLADAVIILLQGAQHATCSWQDEPGQYRWLLERQGDELEIKILRFEETFSRKLDEQGERLFSTRCTLARFAVQVHGQLQRLLVGEGAEACLSTWDTRSRSRRMRDSGR